MASASVEANLSRALEALHSHNSALALQLLIAAWRDRRTPRLSAAVFQLSQQISAYHGPILGEGPAFHQAWLEREAAGDPLDGDALCPGLISLPAVTLVLRVERMIRRGPDPRTARALYQIIAEVPTTALSNYNVYKTVFAALGASFRDPQYRELLEKRIQTQVGGDTFWPKFEHGIVKLLKNMGQPDELDDREAAILGLIEGRIPHTRAVPLGEGVAMLEPQDKEVEEPRLSVVPRTLAGAIEAWDGARRGEALAVVLEVWRKHRTRELGELVEAIGRVLPTRALPGLKGGERDKNWALMEEKRQLADLPVLLATIAEGTVSVFEERLSKLITWPSDPRIGSRIIESVTASWYSSYRTLLWKLLDEGLVLHGDARLLDYLDASGELLDRSMHKLKSGLLQVRKLLPITPLSAEDGERVAALMARVAAVPNVELGLVEAIYAEPDSDAPRLVYADWLSEREDPRGELIMLQCSPAQRGSARRLQALLASPKALLGPVEAILRNPKFERGFLVHFELTANSPVAWREFKDDPRLVAVRSVGLGWYHSLASIRDLYSSRWMGKLAALSGVSAVFLEELALLCLEQQDRGEPGLSLVHLGMSGHGASTPQGLLSDRCFPMLKSLLIQGWSVRQVSHVGGAWFWPLPLLRRVERITFEIARQETQVRAAVYAQLIKLPGRLVSVTFQDWGGREPREFLRNPDGSWPQITF